MNTPKVSLEVFDWPTALAMAGLGVVIGYFFWRQVWPMRLEQGIPLPVGIAAIVGLGTFVVPFVFLCLLRWITDDPWPVVAMIEVSCFALGGVLGVAIWNTNHE